MPGYCGGCHFVAMWLLNLVKNVFEMHLFHGMLSILKYIYIFKITPQIYIQFTKCKLKVWKIGTNNFELNAL